MRFYSQMRQVPLEGADCSSSVACTGCRGREQSPIHQDEDGQRLTNEPLDSAQPRSRRKQPKPLCGLQPAA